MDSVNCPRYCRDPMDQWPFSQVCSRYLLDLAPFSASLSCPDPESEGDQVSGRDQCDQHPPGALLVTAWPIHHLFFIPTPAPQPWCADWVLHVCLLPLDPVPGVPPPGPPKLPAAVAAGPDHLLHGLLHRNHHPLQWGHSCHGWGSCAQAPHTAGYGDTLTPTPAF